MPLVAAIRQTMRGVARPQELGFCYSWRWQLTAMNPVGQAICLAGVREASITANAPTLMQAILAEDHVHGFDGKGEEWFELMTIRDRKVHHITTPCTWI